jgi:serine/threonine protein kinase
LLDVGATISGRFTIEALAASGGMARVYRARDSSSGNLIALKIQSGCKPAERERFARVATRR